MISLKTIKTEDSANKSVSINKSARDIRRNTKELRDSVTWKDSLKDSIMAWIAFEAKYIVTKNPNDNKPEFLFFNKYWT